MQKIKEKALALKSDRANADATEAELRWEIDHYCSVRGGGLELAKQIKATPQYVSDIRHGRRKVSDAVVERLGRLK